MGYCKLCRTEQATPWDCDCRDEEPEVESDADPGAANWEYQAGELPIKLSFSIKVF